jgi:hypothetical protein
MQRLRCILRQCSVPQVRCIPCEFARLACKLFTKPSKNRLFTMASKLPDFDLSDVNIQPGKRMKFFTKTGSKGHISVLKAEPIA